MLARYDLPAECLELELTESLLMGDLVPVQVAMQRFSAAGVDCSIDDFGTGYSSLSYLKQLNFKALKIDRAFVRDIETAPGRAMVETILAIANVLNLSCIAEGVENPAQLALLRDLRCQHLQGYLCGKPMPASAIGSEQLHFDMSAAGAAT